MRQVAGLGAADAQPLWPQFGCAARRCLCSEDLSDRRRDATIGRGWVTCGVAVSKTCVASSQNQGVSAALYAAQSLLYYRSSIACILSPLNFKKQRRMSRQSRQHGAFVYERRVEIRARATPSDDISSTRVEEQPVACDS